MMLLAAAWLPVVPATLSAAPKAQPKSNIEQGLAAARERDWTKAAKFLEAAHRDKPLDIRGLLVLSLSYRQLEECGKAIPHLKEIQQRANRKKLPAKEAKLVRSGLFLLARCYAKGGDAGRALYILNGYMLDPRKYASELRQSLSLIDFGGIRTQSDFEDYEKAARKALGKIGNSPDAGTSGNFEVPANAPSWDESVTPGSTGSASGF